MAHWEIRLFGNMVVHEMESDTDPGEVLDALKDDFDETASLHWVPDPDQTPEMPKKLKQHKEGPTH